MRYITSVVALAAAACGGGSRLPAPSVPAVDPCLITTPGDVDSASIIVTSPVDLRNSARPTTWGERFVFSLTRDTTARLDCRGQSLADAARAYRATDAGRSTLRLEPPDGSRGPRLAIHIATDVNARDLIDRGTDLVLTESPTLAAYAASRGDVMSVPLGWNRTWVFASALPGGLGLDSSSTLRSELARDVVPADARPAEQSSWWTDTTGCGAATAVERTTTPAPGTSRVVYPRDEPIARALAERLVALAGAGTVAAGLTPNVFESALKAGTELGYVFPLARRPEDRCRSVGELLTEAPWLAASSGGLRSITPLIDSRLRAVIRRDRLGLAFTSDSSLAVVAKRP